MTDEEKAELAISLLERSSSAVSIFAKVMRESNAIAEGMTLAQSKVARIKEVLPHLEELVGDGPDENWWRDFFLVTGDHMVLTEEGWIPASMNTKEYTGYDPEEVLDEVNVPVPA